MAELAQAYDVTTETVRRDLAVLDKAGRGAAASHGGAVPARALHLVEAGVGERDTTRADAQRRHRRGRRRVLPPQRSQRAPRRRDHHQPVSPRAMPTDRDLIVVTNSVPIAGLLAADADRSSLQLLGGRVRGLTQAAVGEQVLRVLETLRVDIAFIGTNGISVGTALSTPDTDEAAVKRAMVQSRQLRCGGRRLHRRSATRSSSASPPSTASTP